MQTRQLLLLVLVIACLAQNQGKWFEKIFIINFENTPLFETIAQNYFRQLVTTQGALLNNYYGVTHPSQPNYLTQIAGDFFGKNTDDNVNLQVTSVVDLLEAKHISWKSYQEDYPGNCFTGSNYNRKYYRKHNPFMSIDNVRTNDTRCANIVNAEQLQKDMAQKQLPQYMYYTPNIDHDAHNTGVAYADKWFSTFLPPLLNNAYFMNNTLVFITFDEDNYKYENHIYAAVIGVGIKAGAVDANRYNHYNLLRTVEDNWSLGTLNRNDTLVKPFQILTGA